MKITLYTPSGRAMYFTNCEIESNISPDITFTGEDEMGRLRHITTSLPFLNEHETPQDFVDKVIDITDRKLRFSEAAVTIKNPSGCIGSVAIQ